MMWGWYLDVLGSPLGGGVDIICHYQINACQPDICD